MLRFAACAECIRKGLDTAEEMLYLDKVDSVSALEREREQALGRLLPRYRNNS